MNEGVPPPYRSPQRIGRLLVYGSLPKKRTNRWWVENQSRPSSGEHNTEDKDPRALALGNGMAMITLSKTRSGGDFQYAGRA